ncbi:MAG: hypothetical protein PVF91_06755 [Chromatiales bacterium]|jgi:hypothetical protein
MRIEHRERLRALRWPTALLACLVLAGCNENAEIPDPVPPTGELTQCQEPRPESCAQVYEPVCATRDSAQSSDWQTYSNGCVACADARVYAYREGACELP